MEEKKLKGKELILAESEKLFMKNGYHDVSIRDIARASEMTNAAIYYHFEDKEALFLEVIDQFGKCVLVYFDEISKKDLIPKEKIEKMLAVFLNLSLTKDSSFTRIMNDYHYLMREKHKQGVHNMMHSSLKLIEPLSDCFLEAENEGEIKKLPEPFNHARLLFALNRSVVTTLIHDTSNKEEAMAKHSAESLAKMIVDLYWHGIVTNIK